MSDALVKLAPAPDFSLCRPVRLPDGTWSPVKEHAKIGVRALLANPYFFITDEMGGMKSAQSIIAAQFLWLQNIIDRVIVVAPNSVLEVWEDEELGELQTHLFVPAEINLYRGKMYTWEYQEGRVDRRMPWIIANYEFIRRENRLEELLEYVTPKTMLILDESSAVRGYNTDQTKACSRLRWQHPAKGVPNCTRIVLLNGTPIGNSPLDLFSQGNMMHPSILDCKGITHFRARYAEMGGYMVQTPWGQRPTQIIGWKNLDDLQRRFAPYVLRRLKKDCMDLPPVLPPVTLAVPMTPATWKIYAQMRDDMVAWLSNATVSLATQTITKVLRLSQITSGFLGGIEPEVYQRAQEGRPEWLKGLEPEDENTEEVREVGREKLDCLLDDWLPRHLEADPNLKLLVWCRFIPELERLLRELAVRFPTAQLGCIAGKPMLGKSKKEERDEALRLLNPRTAPEGFVVVGGTYGTGSLGLNLTACHTMVKLSYDYSYWKDVQTDARIDRPGQVHPVSQFNIAAVGPKGQKTIDHVILRAVRDKADIASWTTGAWVRALQDD